MKSQSESPPTIPYSCEWYIYIYIYTVWYYHVAFKDPVSQISPRPRPTVGRTGGTPWEGRVGGTGRTDGSNGQMDGRTNMTDESEGGTGRTDESNGQVDGRTDMMGESDGGMERRAAALVNEFEFHLHLTKFHRQPILPLCTMRSTQNFT